MPTTIYGHHLRTNMEEFTGMGSRPCPTSGCLNVTLPDLDMSMAHDPVGRGFAHDVMLFQTHVLPTGVCWHTWQAARGSA